MSQQPIATPSAPTDERQHAQRILEDEIQQVPTQGNETSTRDPQLPNYDDVPWYSRVSFSWMGDLVTGARDRVISITEMPLPRELDCYQAYLQFKAAWEAELHEAQQAGRDPALWRALFRCYWKQTLIAGIMRFLWSVTLLLAAFYFVLELVRVTSRIDKDGNRRDRDIGLVLAFTFFICCIAWSICQQQVYHTTQLQGLRLRGALVIAVYHTALRLEGAADAASDTLNLISSDCSRLQEACTTIHALWASPLEAIAIVLLMFVLVGQWAFIAVAVTAALLVIQLWIAQRISTLRSRTIERTDLRSRVMAELLSAIKVVKFYAWEDRFMRKVEQLRRSEVRNIYLENQDKTWDLMLVFGVPPIIALALFSVFSIYEGDLTPAVAFTTLSLFNTLRFPLVVLPKAIKNIAEAVEAQRRIQAFLLLPAVVEDRPMLNSQATANRSEPPTDQPAEARPQPNGEGPAPAAKAEDVSIGYISTKPAERAAGMKESIQEIMHRVGFEVAEGQKAAMVGPLGSGKTSIFMALLGEARVTSGELSVSGSIAYVPQEPWIKSGTIRDNILFGKPYDPERYRRTVFACALEPDFAMLPEGDMTVLAERGINLSGGQRQRICLARAVYSDADTILLDNPLSAVDWHTSEHIMKHCIRGMLANKTVIMAMHQVHLLSEFDRVIVVKNQEVAYRGEYHPGTIRRLLPEFYEEEVAAAVPAEAAAAAETKATTEAETKAADQEQPGTPADAGVASPREPGSGRISGAKSDTTATSRGYDKHRPRIESRLSAINDDDDDIPRTQEQQLLQLNGKLDFPKPLSVFARDAGPFALVLAIVIGFCLTQTVRIISDWWIYRWSNDDLNQSNEFYIWVYAIMVAAFLVLLLVRGYLWYFVALRAATRIHNRTFLTLLKSSLNYFSILPIGDILNTLSKDQDTIDSAMPDTAEMTLIYGVILLTSLILICAILPWYLLVFIALIVFTAFMVQQYIHAALVLRGLVNSTTAPIFSHTTESLRGIAVVRAFRATDRFEAECIALTNLNNLVIFHLDQLSLWLGFRLDLMGSFLVFATALLSVTLAGDTMDGASAGLVISNSIQALVFYTWTVRGIADVAAQLSAVERVEFLGRNAPSEPPAGDADVPPDWPSSGDVEFRDVSMRYLPWTDLALKNMTFKIYSREKVGVVGRTGSGKSSVIMALFRMFDFESGAVFIDGVDTSTVPLSRLRSSLAIIPQEPVMFHGSIRSNLDPFGRYSDAELWEALEVAHLKETIQSMPGGLEATVETNGENFSLGQKQLMCLARAFLVRSRILLLDEATAAMDLATDALIQKSIRTHFEDRTIFVIAHRIDTIIDNDRILVVNSGNAVEFDTPRNLLSNPHSAFYKLVATAGSDYFQTLQARLPSVPPSA